MYQRVRDDEDAYRRDMSRMLDPISMGESFAGPERMVPYLSQADAYVKDLIALLPEAARSHVRPAPLVTACNDFRTLLSLLFSREDAALRFTAQRKMYLAKLLLDIDQSRHVQDGPKHKSYFEKLIREGLWHHAVDTNRVEIGFEIDESRENIHYNIGARGPAEVGVQEHLPRARHRRPPHPPRRALLQLPLQAFGDAHQL